MKVLAVHNYYQEPGGEDVVFESETALLEASGHAVIRYTAHNADIGTGGTAAHAIRAIWNAEAVRSVARVIRETGPDVMHVHNTLAVLSPAVYGAANKAGVPVVHTLHNYRMLCPGATLYRDGAICEACVGRRASWPAVVHGCYRGSAAASAVVAAIRPTHEALGTWRGMSRYIALTEFAKEKFVAGGLRRDRITVKPNFVHPDPGVGAHQGGYVLFAGRLSPEKGIRTLLAAAARVQSPSFRLKVVGDGPLRGTPMPPRVEWLGHRSRAEVHALMQEAAVLVFPSEWYETFGVTLIEAFATGLPVLGSCLGAIAEIVTDNVTGRHFSPGDASDLASKIDWALSHPDEMCRMGRRCRAEFEARYTARQNYAQLMEVYRAAVHDAGSGAQCKTECPVA